MLFKWEHLAVVALVFSLIFTGIAIYDSIYGDISTVIVDIACAAANTAAIYFVLRCVPEIEQRKKEHAELLRVP